MQQGQVFELRKRAVDGSPVWAYRYRTGGPGSRRRQLLFPSRRGGYFDLHNFRNRYWKPAQIAAGIVLLRRVYDLRHTFATFALRAGVSTFDLSRYMEPA